jgi:uncharacterized protein
MSAALQSKTGLATRATRPRVARKAVVCQARKVNVVEQAAQKLATAGVAAMLAMGAMSGAAIANEFDIISEPTPTSQFYIDDANALSKTTKSEVQQKLKTLQIVTGYRLELVTVRKLEFESDPFAYSEKVLSTWYPTPEEGEKKGILTVVTTAKEGAIVGDLAFINAVGEELIDSIVGDNIPIYTEEEAYNQTVLSSIDRIIAKLNGDVVPEAPQRADTTRKRNFKTKEETENSKQVTSTVVITLLVIAVVVPMLQYYGYTARD